MGFVSFIHLGSPEWTARERGDVPRYGGLSYSLFDRCGGGYGLADRDERKGNAGELGPLEALWRPFGGPLDGPLDDRRAPD